MPLKDVRRIVSAQYRPGAEGIPASCAAGLLELLRQSAEKYVYPRRFLAVSRWFSGLWVRLGLSDARITILDAYGHMDVSRFQPPDLPVASPLDIGRHRRSTMAS